MPNGFALQVGCPSGCQGSNLSVLPLFSLHFLASLIPLCFDALKWLSLHALCAHRSSQSLFPCPWNFSLNLKSCSDFPIEKKLTLSAFLSVCLSYFPSCTLFSSQTMALVFKILSKAYITYMNTKHWHVCVPRCFDQPCSTRLFIPSNALCVESC